MGKEFEYKESGREVGERNGREREKIVEGNKIKGEKRKLKEANRIESVKKETEWKESWRETEEVNRI